MTAFTPREIQAIRTIHAELVALGMDPRVADYMTGLAVLSARDPIARLPAR